MQPRNPQRSIQATVDAILSTRKPFEVPKDPAIVKGIFLDLANCIKDLEEDIARLRQTLSTPLSHENPLSKTSLQLNREERIAVVSRYPDHPSPPVEGYSVNDLTRDLRTFGYYEDRARHFGSSSSRKLVKDALDVKKEYTGGADFVNVKPSFKRLEFWSVQPVIRLLINRHKPDLTLPFSSGRKSNLKTHLPSNFHRTT